MTSAGKAGNYNFFTIFLSPAALPILKLAKTSANCFPTTSSKPIKRSVRTRVNGVESLTANKDGKVTVTLDDSGYSY